MDTPGAVHEQAPHDTAALLEQSALPAENRTHFVVEDEDVPFSTPAQDVTDLDNLDMGQLVAVFEEELARFRELVRQYRFHADQVLRLNESVTGLCAELKCREEELEERAVRLAEGRYVEEEVLQVHVGSENDVPAPTVQLVYRMQVTTPAEALDFSAAHSVARERIPARPAKEAEPDDGFAVQVTLPVAQARLRIVANIAYLRRLCADYAAKVGRVRGMAAHAERALASVQEEEQNLREREEDLRSRERAFLAASVEQSTIGG